MTKAISPNSKLVGHETVRSPSGDWLFHVTLTLTFALSLMACTVSSEKIEYSRAEEAAAKNDYAGAVKLYRNLIDRNSKTPLAIKAAKEAARLTHFQLNQPKDAIPFYKHVVLYSPSAEERIEAERKLADIDFTQTLDYPQAITEYNRLLELPHSQADDYTYRLSVARSYYYLGNFYQAKVEIEGILNRNFDKNLLFDALLLKANIYLTSKNLDDAVLTLKQIIEKYPERAKTESIGLILAVTYEEQKNFAKAIETLLSIKDTYPRKDFIDNRIKTLRERQSYLPGAKGWKK